MNKRMFLIAIFVFVCFFCGSKVDALETIIIEEPSASEIVYGEPLYNARLSGGSANVDGKFTFEDVLAVVDAGNHSVNVVFTPSDSSYAPVTFPINIKINKRKVDVVFEREIFKLYDGTNNIKLPSYVIVGIIDEDVYVSGNLEGVLDSILVGENIGVELQGLQLEGEKKENYSLELDGFKATIYPKYLEKFSDSHNRVEFSGDCVPVNSLLYIDKIDDLNIDGYKVLDAYNIYVKSYNQIVEVRGLIKTKLVVENFDAKKVKVLSCDNYLKCREIDYKYNDGYLSYSDNGINKIVLAEKIYNYDYIWLILASVVGVSFVIYVIVYKVKHKSKIKKYRSPRRRDEYEY